MDREELGRLLLEIAYLEGDFVLRSGKRSKYYLDKYLFETEPRVLRGIVHEMAMMIRNQLAEGVDYRRLAAPELGGVVLGAGLSLELGLPLVLVRKQSKEYGTARRVEGRLVPGESVAVVEDIVTSGGAAISAVEALRGAGAVVEDLYCVVDRQEGGEEAAKAAGLRLRPLFTSSELGILPSLDIGGLALKKAEKRLCGACEICYCENVPRGQREVTVTKAEFVDKLAAKSGLTKKDAAGVVDAFVEVITDSLKKGEDVQFTGFGKFYVQKREAREGINPQTKAKIKIPASTVPKFSAGLALKTAVK